MLCCVHAIQPFVAQSLIDELCSFHVLSAIDAYGYYGIFVGMSIESIGMPLPSEIILPYAGYLAYLGNLNFLAGVCSSGLPPA